MEFEPKPVPKAIIAPEPGSVVKNVVDGVVNSSFPERRGHDRHPVKAWTEDYIKYNDVKPEVDDTISINPNGRIRTSVDVIRDLGDGMDWS